jgi:hypothetical protein
MRDCNSPYLLQVIRFRVLGEKTQESPDGQGYIAKKDRKRRGHSSAKDGSDLNLDRQELETAAEKEAKREKWMTRSTLILVAAIALTGCADVAANIATQVAAEVVLGPAVDEIAQTVRVAVIDGYEYTAEQIEALHKFLGDEGFYELFGGPGANK